MIFSFDCRNKDYNVISNGEKNSYQPVKNDLRTYDNVEKLQQIKEMIAQLVFY